jgi:hypothetical protein
MEEEFPVEAAVLDELETQSVELVPPTLGHSQHISIFAR